LSIPLWRFLKAADIFSHLLAALIFENFDRTTQSRLVLLFLAVALRVVLTRFLADLMIGILSYPIS